MESGVAYLVNLSEISMILACFPQLCLLQVLFNFEMIDCYIVHGITKLLINVEKLYASLGTFLIYNLREEINV